MNTDAPQFHHTWPAKPFRLQLVGIAGTSRDILLSIFALKSYLMTQPSLTGVLEVETLHKKYILPSLLGEATDTIAAEIVAARPDLVGFSTYTWNINAVLAILKKVHLLAPDIQTLLGGPEVAPEDVRMGRFDPFPIDFIIFGEGELPLGMVLDSLVRNDMDQLLQINRLAIRQGDSFKCHESIISTSDLVQDLAGIPSPYLEGIIPADLLGERFQANIESQRGCNFRCAYCMYHANFPQVRYKNPRSVIDEISSLGEMGFKDCRIVDANFLSKMDYAVAIFEGLLERNIRMSFFFEVIPVYIHQRFTDIMQRYLDMDPSCQILVGIGLQTINEQSLQAIRRKLPMEQFDKAFGYLANTRVIIKTDIILGLPYESRHSYRRLLDYISEKMRNGFNYLSLALLRVLPGSELECIASQAGLVVDASDSEHFVYETPTMPRLHMLECLRISAVAFRFFHALNDPERMRLRDFYFHVHDTVQASHVQILEYFAVRFQELLAGTTSDYVGSDFPRAEHYWYFDLHKEIPDEWLYQELAYLKGLGAFPRPLETEPSPVET